MITTRPNDWQKDFELFRQTELWNKISKNDYEKLKDFTASLLASEREKVMKKVGAWQRKTDKFPMRDQEGRKIHLYNKGYIKAIEDVIKLIKDL